MLNQIGKIKLDYSKYPGEDFYSDGAVEEEMLDIAKNLNPLEYQAAIEERKSWPILYHLSPLRENIVDWIPMTKADKVLEVGSGCGAITGALARKAESVTCVDLSSKRSTINAYRHGDCENVTIHVGNFKDIEPDLPKDFDYICLIGVFEYGQGYIGGDTPYEDFLKILMAHLSDKGRMIIAIENKYGLKYFAGCREDHVGKFFTGIENYTTGGGVRTFSRQGLERIFDACGVKESHFYYPYPDYKFMHTLYSDKHLPKKGELTDNFRNFDRDRMLLFDEKNAYDGISEDQLFSVFANSYIAVLGKDFDVEYVKYSNDRAKEYRIRTQIGYNEEGKRVVRKYPMGPDAKEHVRGMESAYQGLRERYKEGKLSINTCKLVEEGEDLYAEFEFVPGKPLQELLDRCLEKKDMEKFHGYFKEYVERIGFNREYPVSDFDLIFANILVDEDTWTLIDYEWTFGKPIDTRELAFRAVYCYILEDESRNQLELDRILDVLQITQQDAENFREQERDFQKMVTGKRLSMAQMREAIGHPMTDPKQWLEKFRENERVNRVQIYEDRGNGYHEEESYLVPDAYVDDHHIDMTLQVSSDVQKLRIDPAFDSCIVRVEELTFNGKNIPLNLLHVRLNGKIGKGSTLVFPTADPNLNLLLNKLPKEAVNTVTVKMEVSRVPVATAQAMCKLFF